MPTLQTGFILSRETAAKNSKKLVGYKTRTLTCGLKNRTARGEGRTASYKSSTPPPRHTKETTKNLNYIRGRKTGHVRLRHFETGVYV